MDKIFSSKRPGIFPGRFSFTVIMSITMYRFIFISLLMPVLFSCGSAAKPGRLEEIRHCDSAVVMYYHTPGDPRFFNMTKVRKMDSLSSVADDVNKRPVKAVDSCTTQGKIYFYGKGGAVYPVYFTRSRGCMQLSFIVTGVKYFSVMSGPSLLVLDDMEKRVTKLSGRKE
jgi:hypothetical protein